MQGNGRIEKFVKLSYMVLRSTAKVSLSRLEDAYRAMRPSIHAHANDNVFDFDAFSYASQRLPSCIFHSSHIILGQSVSFLEESGVSVSMWQEVFAKARRRRYLFDGNETVAAFISSKSDIDDVIPTLICLQIEWNKLFALLHNRWPDALPSDRQSLLSGLSLITGVAQTDIPRIFGENEDIITEIYAHRCSFTIQNLEASYSRYMRETFQWWENIRATYPDIEKRDVYFVSSNTHSLINAISHFAESQEATILSYASSQPDLVKIAQKYKSESPENPIRRSILYYLLMKLESSCDGEAIRQKRLSWEEESGIKRVRDARFLDIPTQIIDLKKVEGICKDAIILNIDYPLGRTAYFVLSKITEHVERLRGVYVIGKAASLFAERGDVLIPSSVTDLHNGNHYHFHNCITAEGITKYLKNTEHNVYDNQKAVTVLGTFLQNRKLLNNLLSCGVTDIEMEFGPYLSAYYELVFPKRYPEEDTITFPSDSIDLGIAHYVSDNPLSDAPGLSHALALEGVDATYAVTYTVLDRILDDIEKRRRARYE